MPSDKGILKNGNDKKKTAKINLHKKSTIAYHKDIKIQQLLPDKDYISSIKILIIIVIIIFNIINFIYYIKVVNLIN